MLSGPALITFITITETKLEPSPPVTVGAGVEWPDKCQLIEDDCHLDSDDSHADQTMDHHLKQIVHPDH